MSIPSPLWSPSRLRYSSPAKSPFSPGYKQSPSSRNSTENYFDRWVINDVTSATVLPVRSIWHDFYNVGIDRFIPSRQSPCVAKKCLFKSPRKKAKWVMLLLSVITIMCVCVLTSIHFLFSRVDAQSEPPKVETLTYQSVLQNELLGQSNTEVPVSLVWLLYHVYTPHPHYVCQHTLTLCLPVHQHVESWFFKRLLYFFCIGLGVIILPQWEALILNSIGSNYYLLTLQTVNSLRFPGMWPPIATSNSISLNKTIPPIRTLDWVLRVAIFRGSLYLSSCVFL